ncbi:hypothetical protein [Pseudaestuariivita atlantica]|nr:hypothetical protein [Pseudaestuariivita atlantica]
MRTLQDGAKGLNLLMRLNADRLLMSGLLILSLVGATWLAGL